MRKARTGLDDLLETPKKRSFGGFLLWGFIVIVVILVGYVTWARYDLQQKKESLERSVAALEDEEKKQIAKEGYSRSSALKTAQQILEKASSYRINWSPLYRDVVSLERGGIIFYSLSANRERVFNVSGIAPRMEDISALLLYLKKNQKFDEAFVSQISEVRKDEEKAFNFTLSFRHKGGIQKLGKQK